jgi:hypothetical protein
MRLTQGQLVLEEGTRYFDTRTFTLLGWHSHTAEHGAAQSNEMQDCESEVRPRARLEMMRPDEVIPYLPTVDSDRDRQTDRQTDNPYTIDVTPAQADRIV